MASRGSPRQWGNVSATARRCMSAPKRVSADSGHHRRWLRERQLGRRRPARGRGPDTHSGPGGHHVLQLDDRGILAVSQALMALSALPGERRVSASSRGLLRAAAQRGDAPRGIRGADSRRDVLRGWRSRCCRALRGANASEGGADPGEPGRCVRSVQLGPQFGGVAVATASVQNVMRRSSAGLPDLAGSRPHSWINRQ